MSKLSDRVIGGSLELLQRNFWRYYVFEASLLVLAERLV